MSYSYFAYKNEDINGYANISEVMKGPGYVYIAWDIGIDGSTFISFSMVIISSILVGFFTF